LVHSSAEQACCRPSTQEKSTSQRVPLLQYLFTHVQLSKKPDPVADCISESL
jgi:hypothetical protein